MYNSTIFAPNIISSDQKPFFAARKMKRRREGEVREQLRGHLSGVNVMALSTDESILVTGSEDATARIWAITGEPDPNEEDGRLLGELE